MTDNKFPGENNTGHIWDDNLRELTNQPPRWWMIAFWASIIWWVAYGVIYPTWPISAEGPNKGLIGWTAMKEYQEGLDQIQAVRAEYEAQIAAKSAKEILADPGLTDYTVASAKVLFGDNCAACHGAGGQGNPGFPVLADDDWLYGGNIEKLQETITNGRKGAMPAHGKTLAAADIDTLANYVTELSQGKSDPAGQALFMEKGCFACHGPDGKGMQALGSANLTDAIWRFAPGGVESAKYTITHGVNDASDPATRDAVMPVFKDRLDETSIKKLAVYVYRLGGGQ